MQGSDTRAPTRFTGLGINDSAGSESTFNLPIQNPNKHRLFREDFDKYNAAEWQMTSAGTPTIGLVDGDGGILSIATSATMNDFALLQSKNANFLIENVGSKPIVFQSYFSLSDATKSAFLVGLLNSTATFASSTNGIFFQKVANSNNVDFVVKSAGTAVTYPAIFTMDTAVNTELCFYWDGITTLTCFKTVQNSDGTSYTLSNSIFSDYSISSNMPTVLLCPSIGVQAGTASAQTLLVDNIFVYKQRITTPLW